MVDAGGGALILQAVGLGEADGEIRQLFVDERGQDYGKLAEEAQLLAELLREEKNLLPEALQRSERQLRQLRERLAHIQEIDFFGTPMAASAVAAIAETEHALKCRSGLPEETPVAGRLEGDWSGRLWVTRTGVYVDRLACAWIILRFLDPAARFAFVRSGEALPEGAVPFDMAGVEFGHHGPRCSAETFATRFHPEDTALQAVAEVVHDLDLKDADFGRTEAPGLKRLLDGLCATVPTDPERVQQALPLFDAL